ncbi:MAG TPA: Error-prone repair protein ImuA [Chitinophagaceae bacterium]|nr:Error-prone repair protein ImuA [Chitinophagaceae bacterium]
MFAAKADIIAQLRRDILPLQGLRSTLRIPQLDTGLGVLRYAFPNASFPLGVVHEFCYNNIEQATASCGFIAGVLSMLMREEGVSLWISSSRILFPPALKAFGIAAEKIIFLDLQKEKHVLWAMEEALKCDGIATVIAETRQINFTASRRLQLAAEQNSVTGFILHPSQYSPNATACVTRWSITPLSSILDDNTPGVGFPRWNVELLKVRNGKPGAWEIEWAGSGFRHISKTTSMPPEQQKKTG